MGEAAAGARIDILDQGYAAMDNILHADADIRGLAGLHAHVGCLASIDLLAIGIKCV